FSDPGPEEALVSPLFGCMEGNMGHAVDRRPIDLCLARGEARVVVGNAGVLAKQTRMHQKQLIPIPQKTAYPLEQWAAFSLRYVTAWSNWELAYGTLRLLPNDTALPHPEVWGWGGGVSLGEL